MRRFKRLEESRFRKKKKAFNIIAAKRLAKRKIREKLFISMEKNQVLCIATIKKKNTNTNIGFN